MTRQTRRRVFVMTVAVLVVAAVVWAFLPDPVPVETATAARGALEVVVEEEGETRLHDRYIISAPVAAFARRIELEPGDLVQHGEPVVRLEPPRAAILDPRAQAEADARVRAARAALADATVAVERASADRGRSERLFEAGALTRRELEQAQAADVHARAARDAARAELAAAQASARTAGAGAGASVPAVLRAPAGGRVLAVHRRSEGHVNPGEPLIEVGDTRHLEIWADVLSQDAVRIRPGAPVVVDQWGGDGTLDAVVTRVEPEGFMKISALGVEEQRVQVRAELITAPALWTGLGSGYRVLARFVVWSADDVLQVPSSALFRTPEGWAVFVVDDGRARVRAVEVGQQAGLQAQIMSGIDAGAVVVVHPPNELAEGARVTTER